MKKLGVLVPVKSREEQILKLFPDRTDRVLDLERLVAAEQVHGVALLVDVDHGEPAAGLTGEELDGRRLPDARLPDQEDGLRAGHAGGDGLEEPAGGLRQAVDWLLDPGVES